MKHKFLSLFAVLAVVANFSWATDYYYRGDDNSWGATKMTPSEDGLYAYIQSSNNANQFKIATSTTGYDYNYSYVSKGFNSTDVSNIGDYGKDNCYCWQSGTYYILIYYPNMYKLNTSSKPKICASTTLPKKSWYIKTNWNGSGWEWKKMTTPTSGSEYTYEGKWGDEGCNINTTNSDDNSGWIDKTKISGYASFSKGNDVIFTYNPQTNSLSVTDKEYEVQVATEDANKGTVSHSWVYAHPYTQVENTITATPKTGYAFDRWEGSEGVTVNSPSSASTTLKASQTGTVTAYFKAATTYNISYCQENHFTFTNKSTTKAAAGETVSFSISVNTGCKLNSVTVLDVVHGNPVQGVNLQNDGNGNYTFTMPAEAVTISVMAEEVLTTTWELKGTFVDDFKTSYAFNKKTGEAALSVAYTTLTLDAYTNYQFKLHDGSSWYGNNNSEEKYWIKSSVENWTFYSDAGNCYMQTKIAGDYVFKVDYSGSNPKVSVTYPTETSYNVTVIDYAGSDVKSIGNVNAVAITAADKDEYRFTSWTIDSPDNIHFSEGSTSTKTISITATGEATLTANYEELPKVYFDNNLGWENVFVYFNVYWDSEGKGAGAKGNPGGQMKQIGETNRYYYAYDVDSPTDKIAFTSTDQRNNNNFWATSAVYRKDFGAALPIFVSINEKSETRNETDYYNKGTWIKEDVNSGYYIIGSGDALGNWNKLDANQLKRTSATDAKATVAIQLKAGTYEFKLNTITDQYYGNGGTISTNVTGWTFEHGLGNCTIEASESGYYQFTFDFTTSKLDVSFPAYYLKYPWGTGLDDDWKWKKLDVVNDDGTYSIYDLYAIDGKGIDYNTKADNAGATHIGYADIDKVGTLQSGKPARFTYNPQTNAVTIENMYFPITMNKYGYATLYHKENLQIPEGVTAKYVTGTSGVLLTYQEVEGGVIPKQTGVMLFALDMKNEVMEFEGVAEAKEEAPENIMGGSHDAEVVNNSDIHYILTTNNAGQVGMFWPKNTDEGVGEFTNAANKAYVYLPGSTQQNAGVMARKGYLFAEEVNTPTELVDVNTNVNANGKVIRNGQLIIIREGIQYNALGEIVK